MKISTRGRYALRTLADLARYGENELVPLKDIAARQDISFKYLEQIVTQLGRSNLIRGVRGPNGGYCLSKKPSEYSVAEILRCVEGSLAPVECLQEDDNSCPNRDKCATLEMWTGLYNVVTEYLESVSLETLVAGAERGCKL